ncbi:MAG: hydrogenase expression/formation protein HypE, partial [Candidatus Aenigmarchaeota archaeon]|nr:hydrogenase expression/formation protein HypE [Candidatus Aenigmarchaeota archaeon]
SHCLRHNRRTQRSNTHRALWIQGEHKKRCKTNTKSNHLNQEFVKQARDPTRGGISATLNELAKKNNCGFIIDEEKIPVKKESKKICEILGLSPYDIASEGRFVCIVSKKDAIDAEKTLQKFNPDAKIIGEVTNNKTVTVKTKFGERILPMPSGNLVPRIC